ncbi:MAG: hypothetical protein GX161_07730 [Firmicutes bacterium]|nr:hypothetical protein [Bacillota bacterium]
MASGPFQGRYRESERYGKAALIDVETTGLDRQRDEVVELAVVLFLYDRTTGRIVDVLDEYTSLRDPGRPIPKSATAVHGIDDRDVRGKRLDDRRVLALLGQAEFLVAHNAAFDRAFIERLYPQVKRKPWVCSMNGIPWKEMGFSSRALQSLMHNHSIVSRKAHRGANDALATLSLLGRQDKEGRYYFQYLLEQYEGKRLAAKAVSSQKVVATDPSKPKENEVLKEPALAGNAKPVRLLYSLVLWPVRVLTGHVNHARWRSRSV